MLTVKLNIGFYKKTPKFSELRSVEGEQAWNTLTS